MLNIKIPKAWILLVIFASVFIVPTVNATGTVTYTCCKNFTTNTGTPLETFNNIGDWTAGTNCKNASNVNTAIYTDTSNFKAGTSGIGMGMVNSTCASIDKTVNWDLSNANNIQFFVYAPNSSNISFFTLFLSNDAGFANRFQYSPAANPGWNMWLFNRSEFTTSGAPSWGNPITTVRLMATSNKVGATNDSINVTWALISTNVVSRPKAIITFDFGSASVLNNATSTMNTNNQRGVIFLPTAWTGNGGVMSLSQLQTLYSSGWDISSLGVNHLSLTTLSATDMKYEINTSQDYLNTNGFTRSSRFFAYPSGKTDNDIMSNVSLRYVLGRLDLGEPVQANVVSADNVSLNLIDYRAFPTTPDYTIISKINDTIYRNGSLILLFHNITDDASDTLRYKVSNFTNISNYLASRSADIDVITFYDYINIIAPNNTPVLGKTVNINASTGLSEVVVNSYINDQTVNMVIVPSSGSSNVTVSTWNTGGDYHRAWSESSDTTGTTASHVMGDLPANTPVKIKKNGVVVASGITNSTGYITFTSSSSGSTTFELYLSTQEEIALQNGWCNSGNSSLNGAFLVGTILAFVVGAVLLFSGINNIDIKFAVAGVLVIIGTVITLVLGNVISSRLLVCG